MEAFPCAERCGPFIRHVLDELNCNVHLYDKEEIKDRDDLEKYPGHYGGLYVLYMKPSKESDVRYPIYVGTTKQSFRQRFQRHALTGGFVKKIWREKFPVNVSGLGVYAWCTHYEGAAARRIKSILLDTFNFAQDQARNTLDTREQYPVEWTDRNLSFPWDDLRTAAQEGTSEDTRIGAEKGGPFIRFMLDTLNCNIDMYDGEEIRDIEDIDKFPGNFGGLYIFYMKADPASELRFPIYVGVTKQSFKSRFHRHAVDSFNGVLYKAWNKEFEGKGLYAVCTHLQGKQASILKRFLHLTFNFPLKRNRLGQLKGLIDTSDQYPAEFVKDNYDIPWEKCVQKINAVN